MCLLEHFWPGGGFFHSSRHLVPALLARVTCPKLRTDLACKKNPWFEGGLVGWATTILCCSLSNSVRRHLTRATVMLRSGGACSMLPWQAFLRRPEEFKVLLKQKLASHEQARMAPFQNATYSSGLALPVNIQHNDGLPFA